MFGAGFLLLGLLLMTEAVVGSDVWRRRPWRAYAWPALAFTMGVLMWPVMVFFTNSAIHMVAHGAWAQTMMLAGAAQLGLVRGKLQSRYWELTMALALFVSGAAFLIHEQNGWLFARSAFLHHAIGWTLILGSVFPVLRTLQPRVSAWQGGLAVTIVAVAVLLFCDRNLAPIFGHLSEAAVTSAR
jgi:hypothetical protein